MLLVEWLGLLWVDDFLGFHLRMAKCSLIDGCRFFVVDKVFSFLMLLIVGVYCEY